MRSALPLSERSGERITRILEKNIKNTSRRGGTSCPDVCEGFSSGEQAPRSPPLTSIISAKSPLLLAKTEKSREDSFFYVFSAVAAEFWSKTVRYLRIVRELVLRHRTEEQHVRSQTAAVISGVFFGFFQSVLADQCGDVMKPTRSCDGAAQQGNTFANVTICTAHNGYRGTDCRQDGNDELDDVLNCFFLHFFTDCFNC